MRGGRARIGGIGGFLRVEGFVGLIGLLIDGRKGHSVFLLLLLLLLLLLNSCMNESSE
jgi:hypothetical protein